MVLLIPPSLPVTNVLIVPYHIANASGLSNNQIADYVGAVGYNYMVGGVCAGLGYGLCLTLIVTALRILWPRQKSHRWLLLVMTCLLFVSSTGFFISKVSQALISLRFAINPSSDSVTDIFTQTNQDIHRAELAVTVFQELNFIAGDAIVVWRAVILSSRSKMISVGLWLLMFASFVLSIFDVIFYLVRILNNSWQQHTIQLGAIDAATMFASFGVNLISTMVIVYQAWGLHSLHRDIEKPIFPSRIFKVLLLLIECGATFCVLQLLNALATVVNDVSYSTPVVTGYKLYEIVIQVFTPFFAAMLPCLILIILATQKSAIDNSVVFGSTNYMELDSDEGRRRGESWWWILAQETSVLKEREIRRVNPRGTLNKGHSFNLRPKSHLPVDGESLSYVKHGRVPKGLLDCIFVNPVLYQISIGKRELYMER
ncbi:hypothetical protein L218DRAFT_990492 [Marasmius fiardii PR-910]|nr:hypothetical protein L218DRAFT_990492 [Marasmius fiardii PR-910]